MQRTRSNARRRIIFEVSMIVLLVLLVVADQVTKICVKNLYETGEWTSTQVIKNFFYFTYVENTGSAWSFLSDVSWAQTFFKIITGVALVLFAFYYYFVTKKRYKWLKVALVLIIAGTIGNFIDRLAYNYVVDFLSFIFGDYHFPVFNLADSFMTVGIIMLLIHYLFLDKNALFKKSKKDEEKVKKCEVDSELLNDNLDDIETIIDDNITDIETKENLEEDKGEDADTTV